MDFYKIWKNLKDLPDDEFIDEEDKETLLEYLNDPCSVLMEMANVRGMDIKLVSRLPFSFYFCGKDAVHQQHGIRVKIIWNPSKAPYNADGYMELHGNYNYITGSHKYKPTEKELKITQDFFKKYKVLFAAVWENILYDGNLQDYFKGQINLRELISNLDIEDENNYYLINHCKNLEELEECVRKNNIFNMND